MAETTQTNLLQTVSELSREFGTRDYLKGGGGNSSAKNTDTLWVKPSGTVLAELTPDKFVAMDRKKLAEIYTAAIPTDPTAREAVVKDMMAAAVRPGETGRASVEAPLHDILAGRFVVHTHPPMVNGLTCARNGAAVCATLFPDALWVPYVDPGFTLCMDIRKRVKDYAQRQGRQPTLIILENHGIFVTDDTGEKVRGTYQRVMTALRAEYQNAGVATELQMTDPANLRAAADVRRAIQAVLGPEAAFVVGDKAFTMPPGPLTPDHMVYAKAYPYEGPLTAAGVTAFQKRRGYLPRVFITEAGVLGVGPTQKKAELALELAEDGALVLQLTDAFGGVQYLTDAARDFIENWEVESYRQQQMQ